MNDSSHPLEVEKQEWHQGSLPDGDSTHSKGSVDHHHDPVICKNLPWEKRRKKAGRRREGEDRNKRSRALRVRALIP